MNTKERINTIREQILAMPSLCLERAQLFTESYKATEGLPHVLRRAKALEKLLSEMNLHINPGELLIGSTTGKRVAAPLLPEIEWRWYISEADTMAEREHDKVESVDVEREALENLLSWWDGKSLYDMWRPVLPDACKELQEIAWSAGGANPNDGHHMAHCCPGFERVLTKGLSGLKAEVDASLSKLSATNPDDSERIHYLNAMKITLDAVITFAKRYSDLANAMAQKEKDPERKAELELIAHICKNVPEKPAESFYEAMQSLWLIYITVMLEGWGPGIGFGRVDQYLYPFYKKDIENGVITKDKARLLITLFLLKLNELIIPFPAWNRRKSGGQAAGRGSLSGVTLGGMSRDGTNNAEELTRLFLEAEEDVMLGEDLVFRIHSSMSDAIVMRALEMAKKVRGKTKFIGDDIVIRQQMNDGKPFDIAREYSATGCFIHTIEGRSHDPGADSFNLPLMLELALNDGAMRLTGKQVGIHTGDPRTFKSYEDVWAAYKAQVAFIVPRCLIGPYHYLKLFTEYFPQPLQSTLYDGCIEKGVDIANGGTYPHATSSVWVTGIVDVGDSLAAIKKTVFDDKKITMVQLIDALDKNFEGEDRVWQVVKSAPKFGNDIDYVDNIVNDVLVHLCDEMETVKGYDGRKFTVSAGSIRGNISFGEIIGALPDGRKAGEALAEGGISPHQGRNMSGSTATANSVTKLDLARSSGGNVLNMKFDPENLNDREKMVKFLNLVKTFADNGGDVIQFNIVSNEMLRDAQKHPEQYKDLLVRVATYSSFFVELPPESQDEIIARASF